MSSSSGTRFSPRSEDNSASDAAATATAALKASLAQRVNKAGSKRSSQLDAHAAGSKNRDDELESSAQRFVRSTSIDSASTSTSTSKALTATQSASRALTPPHHTLRSDAGLDGVVETLLSFRRHQHTYMGYRANHLSQGAVALLALAVPSQLVTAWAAGYRRKLLPAAPEAPVSVGSGSGSGTGSGSGSGSGSSGSGTGSGSGSVAGGARALTRGSWRGAAGRRNAFRPLLRFFEGEMGRREAAARLARLENSSSTSSGTAAHSEAEDDDEEDFRTAWEGLVAEVRL